MLRGMGGAVYSVVSDLAAVGSAPVAGTMKLGWDSRRYTWTAHLQRNSVFFLLHWCDIWLWVGYALGRGRRPEERGVYDGVGREAG